MNLNIRYFFINTDDNETYILVYCAGGYRSALAAKTLKDFGFKNVFNIGGYEEWIQNGGEIQPSTIILYNQSKFRELNEKIIILSISLYLVFMMFIHRIMLLKRS